MWRKKAVVYSFCEEALSVVRYFGQLQDTYEITYLVALSEWETAGKDAGYVCHHPEIGKIIMDELPKEEKAWEILCKISKNAKIFLTGDFYLEGCRIIWASCGCENG